MLERLYAECPMARDNFLLMLHGESSSVCGMKPLMSKLGFTPSVNQNLKAVRQPQLGGCFLFVRMRCSQASHKISSWHRRIPHGFPADSFPVILRQFPAASATGRRYIRKY